MLGENKQPQQFTPQNVEALRQSIEWQKLQDQAQRIQAAQATAKDRRQAEEAVLKALQEVERLFKQRPEGPNPAVPKLEGANAAGKAGHEQARKLLAQGEKQQKNGQVTEAQQTWRQAVELLRKLTSEFPAVPGYRQDLARGYLNLGELGLDTGRYKEAKTPLRSAAALLEQLVRDHPAAAAYRRDLAYAYTLLGSFLERTNRTREAREVLLKAKTLKAGADESK
jgi:tetratricopeptide (TPR) repeat protein